MPESQKKSDKSKLRVIVLSAVSLIPFMTISSLTNVDSVTIRQAAQNLVPVAGFLAGAAIAMTFFYLGKLLDFISPVTPVIENLRQPIRAYLEASVKQGLKKAIPSQDPETLLKAIVDPFKWLADATNIAAEIVMITPRKITRNGSVTFGLLMASCFFSVLTMLTGLSVLLGISFAVLVLGAGSLILGWLHAQDSFHAYLTGAYLVKVFGMGLDLDKSKSQPGER